MVYILFIQFVVYVYNIIGNPGNLNTFTIKNNNSNSNHNLIKKWQILKW